MGAVDAPNADLPDVDRPVPATLLLAFLDVLGRCWEVFQLPTDKCQAVG